MQGRTLVRVVLECCSAMCLLDLCVTGVLRNLQYLVVFGAVCIFGRPALSFPPATHAGHTTEATTWEKASTEHICCVVYLTIVTYRSILHSSWNRAQRACNHVSTFRKQWSC